MRHLNSLKALRVAVEKALDRPISEEEWEYCLPSEEKAAYTQHDINLCIQRVGFHSCDDKADHFSLYESNLFKARHWARGDYEIDPDGFISLKPGSEPELYSLREHIGDATEALLSIRAKLDPSLDLAQQVNALRDDVLGYAGNYGLLGLGLLSIDEFIRKPSGELLVRDRKGGLCIVGAYFRPFLKPGVDPGNIIARRGPAEDDDSALITFYRSYTESTEDFLAAVISYSESLSPIADKKDFEKALIRGSYPRNNYEFFEGARFGKELDFKDGSCGVDIDFPSLISAIYAETARRLAREWNPRRCDNEKCKNLFFLSPSRPGRQQNLYCSIKCRNAQTYRNWYAEHKKKKHKDGIHVQEDA